MRCDHFIFSFMSPVPGNNSIKTLHIFVLNDKFSYLIPENNEVYSKVTIQMVLLSHVSMPHSTHSSLIAQRSPSRENVYSIVEAIKMILNN